MIEKSESVNLSSVKMIKNFFTADECNRLITTAEQAWTRTHASIQNTDNAQEHYQMDKDYRATVLLQPKTPDHKLCKKIYNFVRTVNYADKGWQFHLAGMYEPPTIMLYDASESGRYDMHLDLGLGYVSSRRKIAYSILLNPHEYEGGELVFQLGRDAEPLVDQSIQGAIILFPTYLLHGVKPVIKGKRYVMVGWVHGNTFK